MIGRMFFIIIFILMDLGFLYILIDSIRNRKLASQKIQATFKRFEKHSGRHYSESSFPVFSFEYNGKKYTSVAKEFVTGAEKKTFNTGGKAATYTIWINPNNPYDCYHRKLLHWINFIFVLGLLFLMSLGTLGVYSLIHLMGKG